MIVTSRCGILESYRDTVPLASISFLPSPILESKEKEKKERTRNPERALRRAIRFDDSRSIEVDKISIGGTEVFVPKKKKKRMEDPRKPVVNTVTIRLDVRETDGGNKSGRRRSEKNGEGRREREKEWRSTFPCVPTKSINLVCSSEHVGQQCPLREQPRRTSLRPLFRPRFHVAGEGEGVYPPSLLERCQQHRVARNYPCLDGTRRRVLQRTGHC